MRSPDICVEERVSEAPLAVVRAAYTWICGIVCVVAGERESESERGREEGGGERETTLGQNHSTSTAHQTIDTRSKTL
jgi:hypothetical protein